MYFAHMVPHLPNEAPAEWLAKVAHIGGDSEIDEARRQVLAMMMVLDSAFTNVTSRLQQRTGAAVGADGRARTMFDDTLIIFSSDNGGRRPANVQVCLWRATPADHAAPVLVGAPLLHAGSSCPM